MPIKCKVCGKEIANNLGLSSHVRRIHGISTKEYYDKYLKKQGEGLCKTCGKQTAFINISQGYHKFCSTKCSNNDKETQQKGHDTLIKHYGDAGLKSKKIIDKGKKTCLDKYGAEYSFQSSNNKSKARETKLHKYGSETYNNREKCNTTCISKYGGVGFASSKLRQKAINTCISKYGDDYDRIFKQKASKTFYNRVAKFEAEHDCIDAQKLIASYGQGWLLIENSLEKLYYNGCVFIKNADIERIKRYSKDRPRKIDSAFEINLNEFIESVYKGTIIKNTRADIFPLELDIYLPEKQLAIECDGVYWHSTVFKEKGYHLKKTKCCDKLGVRLIHITDWEWNNKQEICKSIILSAIGQYKQRIYARNCEIALVSSKDSSDFLTKNHLQGTINSSYRLGLYYNKELVQLITLGKSRYKDGEIELLRMCTKLNTQVVGGFSKLMAHQPYNHIISYINRSKFSGKGYKALGFTLIDTTKPSYNYYKGNVKLNRLACQRWKLHKLLEDAYDSNKTESENMLENGWLQVYDCGNFKVNYSR